MNNQTRNFIGGFFKTLVGFGVPREVVENVQAAAEDIQDRTDAMREERIAAAAAAAAARDDPPLTPDPDVKRSSEHDPRRKPVTVIDTEGEVIE
ncbi:MAG: hypothetical protein P8Y27_05015 [Chromatiaceae bacterium]